MEIEDGDGFLGSSEDVESFGVLLGEPSPPGASFLSPDSVLDLIPPLGGSKRVEDVAAEIADSTPEGEDVPGGESKEGKEEGTKRKTEGKAKLEEGEDVPGGESEEGKEEGTKRKAKDKAKPKVKTKPKKKDVFLCIVCHKKFPTGQALGGHMNAHPGVRYKKIEDAYLKMHVNDSRGQCQTPDPQQSRQFEAPPNGFPGPAYPAFQQAAHHQVYWEQSYSSMSQDAQVWTAPSSQADYGHFAPCSDQRCHPSSYSHYQEYSQAYPNAWDSIHGSASSTSQPYLGYSDGSGCDPALHCQECSQAYPMMAANAWDSTPFHGSASSTPQPYLGYCDGSGCDPALHCQEYSQAYPMMAANAWDSTPSFHGSASSTPQPYLGYCDGSGCDPALEYSQAYPMMAANAWDSTPSFHGSASSTPQPYLGYSNGSGCDPAPGVENVYGEPCYQDIDVQGYCREIFGED